MIKKAITLLVILIFIFLFVPLLKASGISNLAEENAGYALLDTLFVTFKELAAMKEPVMEKTSKALAAMMNDAREAKTQNQIDDVFFKRFHRILMVLKIIITPVEKDDAGILTPLYFGEINKFIEDIDGEKYDVLKAGSREAINKLSQAISHEIIDLRIYLETKAKREKLIEEYEKEVGLEEKRVSGLTDNEKQLESLRKIVFINQAMTDYLTDFGVPPVQSGAYSRGDEFNEALSPFYIKELPLQDEWEGHFLVYSGKSCNGVYDGIEGCTDKDIVIVSYGRDGKKENWKYDAQKPDAGLYELKSDKDYDNDLVMWNGAWIRAPQFVNKRR